MEKPTRGRGKQVSATVAPELFSALEDFAWTNRRQRTDVVRQAVEEFAERNNIWPQSIPDEETEQDNEVHHEA